MEATNTLNFCITCHEMKDNVYQEYKTTIHYQNRTGVRATCSDCHVPDPWVHKVVRKIQASREIFYKLTGSINTKEKFEERRLHLARRVWDTMKRTDTRECRNCHDFRSMNPENQRPRARKQHLNAFENGQTCIDCHKGIAHKNIRDQLPEEELEVLEKPVLAYAREVPEDFLTHLQAIEQREKEAEEAKAAEDAAAEAAVKERIEKAVAAAVAAQGGEGSGSAAASGGAASGSGLGQNIDWNSVDAQTVTLFYPGQASFEWIQTGKDHGGARAVTKAGDRCSTCHAKEVKDMGAKIVAGEKVEPTPIPGKRAFIETKVQAAHDNENLYLRVQWKDDGHHPIPFADGGKMDPDNQVKLAVMFAGEGIEFVEQAGCWVTCHNDSRFMPHEPKADALAGADGIKDLVSLEGGITKYLAESRTEVEVAGRRGKPRGGWDKPKSKDELEGLAKAGTYMDLIRFTSSGHAENGDILADRDMASGAEISAEGSLDGDTWTVVLRRPLKSDKPGDISLEPGKLYTVGIAIHDDFSNARFHHVSLEYKLGLDNPEAEINAVKK
jgi:cytochrome c-type protein NapC